MIAPFALVRVAGLPYGAVTELVPPRIRALVTQVSAAATEMEAARPAAEDALFAAASTDDVGARRAALALRRDVHNGRVTRAREHDLPAVSRWSVASASLGAAGKDLEAALDESVRGHLRPALWRAATEPSFLRALALASPELTRTLLDGPSAPQQLGSTKLERSILAYVSRAAAKTSPFSAFCATGVVHAGEATTTILADERLTRAYVNRGHVAAMGRELAMAGELGLAVSRDVRWIDDATVESRAASWVEIGRRKWRMTSPRRTRLHPALGRHLRSGRIVTIDALVAAGLATEAAGKLIAHLVEVGVLVATPVIDAFVPRPAALLGLRALEDAAARVAVAGPAERLALVGGGDNVVLEDCVLAHTSTAELARIGDDVVRALSPFVFERAEHAKLRRAFVDAFGAGGVCRDLDVFFASLPSAPDVEPAPPRADRRRFPVAVLAQVARDGDGELTTVINQLHTGGGPMFARWAAGEDVTATALRDPLRAWIARMTDGRRTVDVPVSGDCNPLQAHPRLSDAVLALPGEPCADPEALSLGDLTLVHDRVTDAFELRGTAGEPLHPVYLGTTVLSALSGAAYWLGVVAQPYEVQRPGADLFAPTDDDGPIVRRPRRSDGRVVLQRARTWLRVDHLRERWFARKGAQRLIDVARDVAVLELPPVFFARRPFGAEYAKPLWVDTCNPFCLDVLERYCDDATWIACVELLPDPASAWPPAAGGARVTELLFEVSL